MPGFPYTVVTSRVRFQCAAWVTPTGHVFVSRSEGQISSGPVHIIDISRASKALKLTRSRHHRLRSLAVYQLRSTATRGLFCGSCCALTPATRSGNADPSFRPVFVNLHGQHSTGCVNKRYESRGCSPAISKEGDDTGSRL